MLHSGQGHVALLGGVVVPAEGPPLTVGTHQVLCGADGVREADVVKSEHVVHHPPLGQLWDWAAMSLLIPHTMSVALEVNRIYKKSVSEKHILCIMHQRFPFPIRYQTMAYIQSHYVNRQRVLVLTSSVMGDVCSLGCVGLGRGWASLSSLAESGDKIWESQCGHFTPNLF